MGSGNFAIDFLLNYITLSLAMVAFISIIFVLIAKRKVISLRMKILLFLLLTVIIAYLIFVIWAVALVGGNPPFASP